MLRAALCLAALAALLAITIPVASAMHGVSQIRISGDADPQIAAHFTGAGTAGDPYRLPANTLIVAANGYGIEITGTSAHFNLSGVTVTGGSHHSDAIRLSSTSNVTIWSSTLESSRTALSIVASHNVTVAANTLKTSGTGVYLERTRDATLRENRIALNDRNVAFASSSINVLVNNNITTATGQTGLHFADNQSYDNAIDTTNTVNGIPLRWYTRLTGTAQSPVVIPAITIDLDRITNVAQIMIHNGSHVRIDGAAAKAGVASGIHVFQGSNVEIMRSTADGNAGTGIFVERSTGTRISNATARLNGHDGVRIQSSNDTVVEWSTLASNKRDGVSVASASNVTLLRQLTSTQNGIGIGIRASGNATIETSTLTGDGTGVMLSDARDAVVRTNTITGSGGAGILIERTLSRVEANVIRDRSPGIGFLTSTGSNLTDNTITLPAAGTGILFDRPESYDNAVSTTNTVNGTAVRWYTRISGSLASPIVLPALRVETHGITNVAQIMLYRTSNVTLQGAIANNGTGNGIVVMEASDSIISEATVTGNAVNGVDAETSRGLTVRGSTVSKARADGIAITGTSGVLLENNVVQANARSGIFVDKSDAPTLRGNAATSNGGAGIYLALIGPGGAAVDNNVARSNVGGITVVSSAIGSLRANTVAQNGGEGISLTGVTAGARIEANIVTDHARGIRLKGTSGIELASNTVTILPDQTGFHFDDETSYDVQLLPSNLVNNVPVRWYVSTVGPVNVSGVRVELRGITNVAQVMLYKVANVTLYDAFVANGTDRGIFVLRSETVAINTSRVENNSRAGIALDSSRDVTLYTSRSDGNKGEGLTARASPGLRASASHFERNTAAGLAMESSGAPGARLEGLVVRNNTRGIVLASSTFASLHANEVRDNGGAGIVLASVTGGNFTNNTIANHAKGIELATTSNVAFRNNTLHIQPAQTGVHFGDEPSYRNTLAETNTVNGVPMRWYSGGAVNLQGVTVDVPGITNVAQIMLHEVRDAVLDDVRARNGTGRGIVLHGSANATITRGTFELNTGHGMDLASGSFATIRNTTLRQNGGHGVSAKPAGILTLDNVSIASNEGRGVSLEGGSLVVTSASVASNKQTGIHVTTPSLFNVSRSVITGNGAGGLVADRPSTVALYENEVRGNGAVGIHLSFASAPRVSNNLVSAHARQIQLDRVEFGDFQGNAFTIQAGETGWHFSDEPSYNNVIGTSNRVNGQPVHWHTLLTGTEANPVVLPQVRSELRGITNIAQVMVYRSSHVRIPDVLATNGTRGVYLHRSSSIVLEGGNVSNNTLYGVHVHLTQSSTLRNLSALGGSTAVQIFESPSNVVERIDARGTPNGVVIQDIGSRDNRVTDIEVNGTARGIADGGWNGQGLLGNNLLVDAGATKRVRVGVPASFADTIVTYRLDSSRVTTQTWTWGDGTPDGTSSAAALLRPTHAYAQPGTYRANLTAITADGLILRDQVSVDVVPPLSEPREFAAAAGARNVTLVWTPPEFDGASPVLKYRIYRGTDPSNVAFTADVPATSLTYVQPSLDNGRAYIFHITAVNADGEGPKAVATATPASVPGTPTSVTATPSPNAATLSWSPPADTGGLPVTTHHVLRSANGTPFVTVATLGNVTNYTDRGLSNGVPYTYAIRAVNALGTGPASPNTTVTPLGPPGPARELRVLAGDAAATLVWAPPSDDGGTPVRGYRVWRSISNASVVQLPDALPATATSFRATGLSNGITYAFAVSAVNDIGEGKYGVPVPAVPTALDTLRPVVFDLGPPDGSTLGASPATISARFVDNDGIAVDTVGVYLDGAEVTANVTESGFVHALTAPLSRGHHEARVVLKDRTGNEANVTWQFRILAEEERVPVFAFTEHALLPQRAAPGANVTALVKVHNEGFAPGNATLSALFKGNALAHAEVAIAEGATVEAAFDFNAPLKPGSYEIELAGAKLLLVVLDPDAPMVNETSGGGVSASAEILPEPTPEGPRRPARSTPPPRTTQEAEVPAPALVLVVVAVALAAWSRRRR